MKGLVKRYNCIDKNSDSQEEISCKTEALLEKYKNSLFFKNLKEDSVESKEILTYGAAWSHRILLLESYKKKPEEFFDNLANSRYFSDYEKKYIFANIYDMDQICEYSLSKFARKVKEYFEEE